MRWLALIVVAGAALRVVGLDAQSFWRDEASTVLGLRGGLDDAVRWVVEIEAMPPLHFVLAWAWAQPFGLGEVGLRSLSALFGVATIPVAYAIGRHFSERAGLIAAALTATNPFLVWYAQEARGYALLTLLTALATLALVKDRPRAWGVLAAAALLTHYFSAFLLVPQALILLRRHRSFTALTPPALIGLALLPLAIVQNDGRVTFLDRQSLTARTADVATHWVAGPFGSPTDLLIALGLSLIALALILAPRERALHTVTAAALVAPVLFSLIGPDYLADRYLIAALIPLLVLVALTRAWPAAIALAALFAFFAIDGARDEQRHREDWRAAARDLGPAVVIATPDADRPLRVYAPGTRDLAVTRARTVVFLASWRFGRDRPPTPPPPSPTFALTERVEGPTTTLVRYDAPAPAPFDPPGLARNWVIGNQGPVTLEVP